jgi:hypothetical protein
MSTQLCDRCGKALELCVCLAVGKRTGANIVVMVLESADEDPKTVKMRPGDAVVVEHRLSIPIRRWLFFKDRISVTRISRVRLVHVE